MNQTIRERSEMDPAYMWDLSKMYESDAAWEAELRKAEPAYRDVMKLRGTIRDAVSLKTALEKKRDLMRLLARLTGYAMLRKSEDNRGVGVSMYNRVSSLAAEAETAVSFLEPEILALPEEQLTAMADMESLKEWQFWLQDLISRKAHMLSGREEMILASFTEAFDASGRAADALRDADLQFADALDQNGDPHQVSNLNFVILQSDPDRILRENVFRSYYKSYKDHIHVLNETFRGMCAKAAAEAKLRGYGSAREMALSADHIPLSVYDGLIDTIHDHMETMYRYVRLRKRLLIVDELHYFDIYMPLINSVSRRYTYEEAQEMVLAAVKPLGEAYQGIVKQAFVERWVDVYPNLGKTGGAYSAGTYDSDPYILLNFSGALESVSTLAHEMGHSLHSWHTCHAQPFQYSDYSMFVAEVASTVNENLLIEQLLAKEKDPLVRLSLLNQYMEGFKGTVYRQAMLSEFEKEAHAMYESGDALDADSLCDLYEKLIRLYFGEDLTVDEEVRYEWARIPHFYMNFYVYVYATGYCMAAALSNMILKEGEPAAKRYLEFLSMGSSAYPLEELKHAGVDMTTNQPLLSALDKFAAVVSEAERIADQLGL